jgi:hypothetical protein
MVASKAGWAKAAAKLALTMAISAFSMATTPAAAADPVSTARAAALRDCSWMSDNDWSCAYRARSTRVYYRLRR